MRILNEINHFYYKMALYELQFMNGKDLYNGLSYNSMLYLNVIAQIKDCTVSKLAGSLGVTKSAATIKINELAKAGAVYRIRSEKDRRVTYISIGPDMEKSLSLYDKIFEEIEKDLNQKYTDEQLACFNEILHVISGYEWKRIQDDEPNDEETEKSSTE